MPNNKSTSCHNLFDPAGLVALLTGATCLIVGCHVPQKSPYARIPALLPGARYVVIRKADPPPGYVEVGPISVTHGYGDQDIGKKGTYYGAIVRLRNRAVRMGATYVQLMALIEPHYAAPGRFENRYVIRGMAYRKGKRRTVPR